MAYAPINSFDTITCHFSMSKPQGYDKNIFIQTLKVDKPQLDDLVYLKNDYELCKEMNIEGILKSFDMVKTKDGFTVYKEYFQGIPMIDFLTNWEYSIPGFISLASRLTKLLEKLHSQNILVKEFIIENLLINPDTLEIKICSLGSASMLSRENIRYSSEFNYYGSLWHIAPEQTGRVGRIIDHRTDFYALGIIFYQILSGRKPFYYTDSLELIHAHIAKNPVAPITLVENVAQPFNDIVLKLMSKNAEDRYQSEKGLLHDLELCKSSWAENGHLDNFELGTKDISTTFYLSEKLYGRKDEIQQLVSSWKSVHQSRSRLYMVAGFSGIGKTRLVNELRKPVIEDRGYFVFTKYDQLNRETALSGIIDGIRSLIQNIFNESKDQIAEWKDVLKRNAGEKLVFLKDLVPEIGQLVELTDDVFDLGPVEGKLRFQEALLSFLRVFDIQKRPIAFFIDDLQWADVATLDLLKFILNSDLKNVLFVGAYRDNEVDQSHPLYSTLREVKESDNARYQHVKLEDLNKEDINFLIADSLQMSPATTEELTSMVMTKTSGNPFFVKEFLQQLVQDRIIHFDSEMNSWMWDLEQVQNFQVSEYVVDLLLKRMKNLSPTALELISLAACIGNTFDIQTLCTITEKNSSEVSDILWEIFAEDFIISLGQWKKHHNDNLWADVGGVKLTNFEFRFPHDRIQQAAYTLIPEGEQKNTHYKIGKLLLSQISDTELDTKLFDILNHFYLGRDHIIDQNERNRLANLNLTAAKKALRNNVIRPASTYFKFGMELIREDQTQKIFKDLLIGQSECEYLLGDYELSEALFDRAVANAKSKFNKADILSKKMALYENTQRHAMAIDTAREALRYLNFRLPKKVTQLHVMKELLTVKFLLRNKSTDQLLNNKKMESPEKILIMKTLMNLWGPAYLLQKQELLAFKILRMVIYSVRYGNSIESALAYAFYGYVASAQLKDYSAGYDFAKLGMALNQKLNDKTLRSKVIVISEGCVAHWKKPYKSLIKKLREGFHVGIESNDIIYAGYAASFMNRDGFLSGEKLSSVEEKSIGYFQYANKVNAVLTYHQMLPWARVVNDLMGADYNPIIFGDLTAEEDHLNTIVKMNEETNVQLPLANYYSLKSIYHYIMGDFEESFEKTKLADPLLDSIPGLGEWIELFILKTLSGLAVALSGQELSSSDLKQQRKNIKLIKTWAENCPDNFTARYELICAEKAQLDGYTDEAADRYKKAIIAADKYELTQWSAIAYERFAEFYKNQNNQEEAAGMLRKSIVDFHEWGAHHKVNQLKEKLKRYTGSYDRDGSSFEDISSSKLDLQSILSASQTLSGEVRLDQLMGKLLLLLVKNAGAQNAYLIMYKREEFVVEASSKLSKNNALELDRKPISEFENLALSVIRQAHYTGKVQTIDDVDAEKEINSSIPKNIMAKSILCLPILSKGETLAILYLDNHISKQVFTQDRLQLLKLLSGQIAISLENAELYQNLEDRVHQRTQIIEEQKLELEKSKAQSDELLLNILPSEVAEELKEKGSCKTRQYKSVTIMFTDFEKFTSMSEKLTPEELIAIVDEHYKAFDNITEKYGVEKIKTIGDSYMSVSGIPMENDNHALNAVRSAIEMAQFVDEYIKKRKESGLPYCRMRIGLHTGAVVAGVVGYKKFAYDIWGDSVNVASRVESACEPGRINISKTTYELVKNDIPCSYRGKIQAKNKGEIEMYYVDE